MRLSLPERGRRRQGRARPAPAEPPAPGGERRTGGSVRGKGGGWGGRESPGLNGHPRGSASHGDPSNPPPKNNKKKRRAGVIGWGTRGAGAGPGRLSAPAAPPAGRHAWGSATRPEAESDSWWHRPEGRAGLRRAPAGSRPSPQ